MTAKTIDNLLIIDWKTDRDVILLDQRELPVKEVYLTCKSWQELCLAIKTLAVRGAPAIGVAGAFALTLAAFDFKNLADFKNQLESIAASIISTRPTAVNLAWGVNRVKSFILEQNNAVAYDQFLNSCVLFSKKIHAEDILCNKKMGEHGSVLIKDGDCILTHCNAGALATAGFGTALGVIYAAQNQGKKFSVFADETRPVLQGARLTAWELNRAGIDVTLICDNMAASLMAQKKITKVIVGADRIAKNGDVANKIGTYGVAILAKYHGIPFYVAAPFSTIDSKTESGNDIVIEQRDALEVTHFGNHQLAPTGVNVYNPAFDVTPNALITGIITEKGIFNFPYGF